MNRDDLKEYYRRLKKGQQDNFVGHSHRDTRGLIKETYENPLTDKEEKVATESARIFAEYMRVKYYDVDQNEIDAAEEDLLQALIDVGEFYGGGNPKSHTDLHSAVEAKLESGGYKPGHGGRQPMGDYDPLTDDDIDIEDIANADRVMGNPDQSLMSDPAYRSSFEDDDDPIRSM